MKKEIKALKMAIKALEKQRRLYSPGHVAYESGIRAVTMDDDDIEYTGFEWVEEDEKKGIYILDTPRKEKR